MWSQMKCFAKEHIFAWICSSVQIFPVKNDGEIFILELSHFIFHGFCLYILRCGQLEEIQTGPRDEYRRMFCISKCIECQALYKFYPPGYRGRGQRGQLLCFYAEDLCAGFCSQDCFFAAGNTLLV